MKMKYYKVKAKCGHVGRNHYLLKCFYIEASDGKEAAKIVREIPRVKHNHKDAIRDVTRITFDEYINGVIINELDMYFKCYSRQEQNFYNCVKADEINLEEKTYRFKKRRYGQRIKNKIIAREMDTVIRSVLN